MGGATSSTSGHASVAAGTGDAAAGLAALRTKAPSQAPEFKSKHLLAPGRRDALLWMLGPDGPLLGNASVYLVDKDYFVVGEVVDLLVEELTHERGEDLYGNMRARDMAWALHREGERALGGPAWEGLLRAFNSLMRAKQRSGNKTTVDASSPWSTGSV